MKLTTGAPPARAPAPPAKAAPAPPQRAASRSGTPSISGDSSSDDEDVPIRFLPSSTRLAGRAPAQPPRAVKEDAGGAPASCCAHEFAVVNGEAKARVYDTPQIRQAFLYYCNSSMHHTQMQYMHGSMGPAMLAPNFIDMCKALSLLEPEGWGGGPGGAGGEGAWGMGMGNAGARG